MSYDDKSGHNGGTQTAPNEVPSRPYLLPRNGVYYFRVRIPADLLRAGVFGKQKEIRNP
jgi:hypothetical protein